MKIEIPCIPGDTVFADLRINPKREPKYDDLTECTVSSIELDRAWHDPLFTVVRAKLDICHTGEEDFGRFWQSEFGKSIFTLEQYFSLPD